MASLTACNEPIEITFENLPTGIKLIPDFDGME